MFVESLSNSHINKVHLFFLLKAHPTKPRYYVCLAQDNLKMGDIPRSSSYVCTSEHKLRSVQSKRLVLICTASLKILESVRSVTSPNAGMAFI